MTLAERLLARLTRPGPALEYIGARCQRRRFIRSGCDLCARECPVQALYPGEGEVRIDEERCTGCLACTAACPTEALVGRDARLAKLPARILTGTGEVTLCCEKAIRSGRELILPCLGGLSREHLAVLALTAGGVTLLLNPCRDCHSAWVPELLQRRLDELRESWADREAIPPIRLHFAAEPPPAPAPGTAPAPSQPGGDSSPGPPAAPADPPDRRDFFRAFREISFHAAVETWGTLREEPGPKEEQWASTKHVPSRVSLLRQVLERLPAARRSLLAPLLPELTVSPACTFCEACVGLCPSGALESEVDEESSRLFFHWARCSACGLCREFCPSKAISISSGCRSAEPGEQRREVFRFAPDEAAADPGSPRRHE
jgi:ferredoxin